MAIDRDDFRDLTRRFLEGFSDEEDAQHLHEVTVGKDIRQQTLNQNDVDKAEAMRSALDKMFFEYRKISSIPSEWLDDGNEFGTSRYDKLEELLMDAAEEMSDLVHDLKKAGI